MTHGRREGRARPTGQCFAELELTIANVVREILRNSVAITLNYFDAWRYLKLVTLATTSFYQRAVPARATFA